MPIITDPVFYMLAIPAVIALGLSKGGFSGIGTIAAPLMAIAVPPIQAIGILTPILVVQDVVTLWSYWRQVGHGDPQDHGARPDRRRRRRPG